MKVKNGKWKTDCTICKTDESNGWLGNSMGTYCDDCSKDINGFKLQPNNHFNVELLAEVFFKRGKGEKITYEELHNKKSDLKFVTFEMLFKLKDALDKETEQ